MQWVVRSYFFRVSLNVDEWFKDGGLWFIVSKLNSFGINLSFIAVHNILANFSLTFLPEKSEFQQYIYNPAFMSESVPPGFSYIGTSIKKVPALIGILDRFVEWNGFNKALHYTQLVLLLLLLLCYNRTTVP